MSLNHSSTLQPEQRRSICLKDQEAKKQTESTKMCIENDTQVKLEEKRFFAAEYGLSSALAPWMKLDKFQGILS